MESKENLSLENGCAENPSCRILKKTDSLFGNLSENCQVELAANLGNESVEEFVLCEGDVNGNYQLNNGFLNANPEGELSVLINSNKVADDDALFLEGDLEVSGSNVILVDTIDKRKVDKSEGLQSCRPDSPTKIDVSGNCINLFVEVFGPLDGIDEVNNNDVDCVEEHMIRGSSEPDQEHACEEVGIIQDYVRNTSFKNEDEGDVVEVEKCVFNVSDLVWVKARTQAWWPGVIADPASEAAKDATKSEKRGPFLVKYFGNPYFTWCSNSELKPFREFFEQMSGQNNSRNFVGSVDRALGEFGRQIKSKMTCPCFLKESHKLGHSFSEKEETLSPMGNTSKSVVLSLSQFETANFYTRLRNLARGFSVPSKIELTEAKTHLSAFYCSVGHCQLPMQLLRPSSDTPQNAQMHDNQNISECVATRRKKRNGNNEADHKVDVKLSRGKESEIRERKKSKYLSYPYVDVNENAEISSNVEQHETDGTKNLSGQSAKITQPSNSGGKNSRKNGSRNSFKGNYMIRKTDNIDACSAELLTELRLTALDYSYPSRSKYSNSLKRFYASFRTYTCLDLESAHNIFKGQLCGENRCQKKPAKAEAPKKRKGVVKETSENQGTDLATANENVSNKTPEKDNTSDKRSGRCKKAEKKKEEVVSASLEPTSDLLNISPNTTVNDLSVISFQQPHSDVPKSKKNSKKKKKMEATPVLSQSETTAKLPDLNGNTVSISFENSQVEVSAMSKEGLVVSPNINGVDASLSLLKDVQATSQSTLQLNNVDAVNGTGLFQSAESITTKSVSNLINVAIDSSLHDSLPSRLLPTDGKPVQKKKKRKDKTCQAASVIPDLNGTAADALSSENTACVENHTSPEDKSTQKRRMLGLNGEDLGAILLLNFAPEHPPPSKETLFTTFSRFGLLRESETQVLNESGVQIVYERTSDAQFAFRSLEKNSPFGDSLVSFKLHRVSGASTPVKNHKKPYTPRRFSPAGALKSPAKQCETPDLSLIKQKVEMMRATLEKAGDNLSPEMRAKLENEIKGFLSRIGP